MRDSDRDFKRTNPQLTPKERAAAVRKQVDGHLSSALKRWFDVDDESYKQWLNTINESAEFREGSKVNDAPGDSNANESDQDFVSELDSAEDDVVKRILDN